MWTDRALYRIFCGKARTSSDGSSKDRGGVTLSYVCPHCHRFPLEDYTWWISSGHGKKVSAIGGALRAAASTTGGTRTES